MCLYPVSQAGSCPGAGPAEIFAFCNQGCSQTDPSLPRSNVTPSSFLWLCGSLSSALTQPHHHHHLPAIPDEMGAVCSVCSLGSTAKNSQPAGSCLHTESPLAPGAVSSTACTSPLPTQGPALALPLLQLGLGLAEPMRITQFLPWQGVRFNEELGDSAPEQQCT